MKYTKFQKVIEFITIILLLAIWVYFIFPSGSILVRNKAILIPILSAVLYILLTVVALFPGLWNIPIAITKNNKEFAYTNIKTMVILLKMEITAVFLYIFHCSIKNITFNRWYLTIFFIIFFGTVIYYINKVRKHQHNKIDKNI